MYAKCHVLYLRMMYGYILIQVAMYVIQFIEGPNLFTLLSSPLIINH